MPSVISDDPAADTWTKESVCKEGKLLKNAEQRLDPQEPLKQEGRLKQDALA
jgi:hypothetical protein